MSSVIRLNDPEDKSAKSRAFRKQFADNLNAALDRKGAIPSGYGRVIGVAELFGVSQNTAANWLKGEGVPELARLPEIAGILGTTVEQLVMGDQHVGTHVIDERYVMVDMHGDDSPEAHAWYTLPEALRSMGLPTSIKMLAVGDDDMAPFLHRGDLAIYDPRVRRIQSNGVFVLCVNDRFLVRRVQRGLKGNVRLICDNPAFDDEILDESEFADENQDGIAVIGVVVGRILLGGR
ncbi:MAG: LexA family transcriptional regulator [Propionivibrio sp.]